MSTWKTPPFRMGRVFHRRGATHTQQSLFEGGGEIDERSARAWLSLGFVPGTATILKGVECLPGGAGGDVRSGHWHLTNRTVLKPLAGEVSFDRASELFMSAVDAALEQSGPHIVPLSGGLDSRIILGALLERVGPREVETLSYGVKGADDFEIGNEVARSVGCRHHAVDLSSSWHGTREELAEIADLTDANNSVFHPMVWHEILRRIGRDGLFWTGYTGDGVGGSFSAIGTGTGDSLHGFLDHELAIQPEWPGKAPREELASLCVTGSILEELVAPVESIWFANHVERYTTHHIYLRDLRYASPFMGIDVVRFFCGLGARRRLGKRFFNRWAAERWPALFQHRTKSYGYALAGHRMRHLVTKAHVLMRKIRYRVAPWLAHPDTTYWNFEQQLRHGPLRTLVEELLNDLDVSGVWQSAEWRPLLAAQDAGERWATVILNGASLAIVQDRLDSIRRNQSTPD